MSLARLTPYPESKGELTLPQTMYKRQKNAITYSVAVTQI